MWFCALRFRAEKNRQMLPRMPNQEVQGLVLGNFTVRQWFYLDPFVLLSLPAEVRQCLQTFLMVSVSARSGIAGSWGSLIFEEPSSCFPHWVHQFTFPPTVFKYFFLSTSLPEFICVLLDDCYFGRCEGVTSVGVDLHFFEDYRYKASFSVPVCPLYFFFGKNVYWDLCPFLNEVGFIVCYSVVWIRYIF